MIFQNIDFHNVAEMTPEGGGWKMLRVPQSVCAELNEGARERIAAYATGVELRFKLVGESADIHLTCPAVAEAAVAHLYYGSIQGGWEHSSRFITNRDTVLHFERPNNLESLKQITCERGLPFNPEVIRIVLPYSPVEFLGVDGEVAPPDAADVPQKSCLCYGSSITHGSLALAGPYTYPFQISQKLKCDYLNLGFAGTAHFEKTMAEHIVSRKDWDFLTLEIGINMLGFTEAEFEERVRDFTAIVEQDGRPVFVTSIFGFVGQGEKAQNFREIVRKYAEGRFVFMDGLDMLNDPAMVSQDGVHPTLEGMAQISKCWVDLLGKHLA